MSNNQRGLLLIIAGIAAWIVGGGYAIYQKYSLNHTFSHSLTNPIVIVLIVLGLILIASGAYFKMKGSRVTNKTETTGDTGGPSSAGPQKRPWFEANPG